MNIQSPEVGLFWNAGLRCFVWAEVCHWEDKTKGVAFVRFIEQGAHSFAVTTRADKEQFAMYHNVRPMSKNAPIL